MEEKYKRDTRLEEEYTHIYTKEPQNGDNTEDQQDTKNKTVDNSDTKEPQNGDNTEDQQKKEDDTKPLKTYNRIRRQKFYQFRKNRSGNFKIFHKGNERGSYKNSSSDSVNSKKQQANHKPRRTFSTRPSSSNTVSGGRTRFIKDVRQRDRTINNLENSNTEYKTPYFKSKFNQGGTYNGESHYKPYNNKQKNNSKINNLNRPPKYTKNYAFNRRCYTNSYTFIKPGNTSDLKYLKPPSTRTSKRSYGNKPKYNSKKFGYRGKNF